MSKQEKQDLYLNRSGIIPHVEIQTSKFDFNKGQVPIKWLLGLQQRFLYTQTPLLAEECLIHVEEETNLECFFVDLNKALRFYMKVQRLTLCVRDKTREKDVENLCKILKCPPRELVIEFYG